MRIILLSMVELVRSPTLNTATTATTSVLFLFFSVHMMNPRTYSRRNSGDHA